MTIIPHLEAQFIKAFLKHWSKKTSKDFQDISDRNNYVNEQFQFTTEVIDKIVALNEKLSAMERRLFNQYRKLEANAKTMVISGDIQDYNIDVEICYWNTHFDVFNDEIEGDPLYSTTSHFMHFQDNDCYDDESHHEFSNKAPLPTMNHCYSFHDLYDHSKLTWFDICNIEDVWMEIKIDYQIMEQILT